MLRATRPDDTDALCRLAAATMIFYDGEIETLREVLDGCHEESDHVCKTWEENGQPLAFAYYAPVEMTDRTWELWWIAVDVTRQGQGLGKKIMTAVEADLKERGARLLLIETSSLPRYDPTRQFYLRLGYVEVAEIPHFYRHGDGKVVFSKYLEVHPEAKLA